MLTATETTTAPNMFAAKPAKAVLPIQKPERSQTGEHLSEAEKRKLEQLRETDHRVRRHEEAHRAAAGALYRGGPNYTYETGPDGKRYAVAGSVQIDTSPGRTPEETVQKAARIRQAALAPVDPSGADRAVALKAARMEDAARRTISRKSLSGGAATVRTNPPPALPMPSSDGKPESRSLAQAAEISQDAPDVDITAAATLSPGDLGGEVWSTVSVLGNAAHLRQERRADEMPMPAPHIDVMA